MLPRLRLPILPSLGLRLLPLAALWGAMPLTVQAQQQLVEQESQRRQALAQEAESLIVEGDTAAAEEKYAEAVNRYSAALDRLPPSSRTLQGLRASVTSKFAATSVLLAKEQASNGQLPKARLTLDAVLQDRADPNYLPARTLRKQLDDPDRFNPAQSPRHADDTRKIEDLFVIANGMYDLADYKAARKAYEQILAVDPTNTAARRGLDKVEQQINQHLRAARDHTRIRMLNEVDSQWETTVPAGPHLPATGAVVDSVPAGAEGDSTAKQKMATLILDRIAMAETPLQEALAYLASRSVMVDTAEPDPNRKGVNIIFNPAGAPPGSFKPVTLDLREVSLGEALGLIADLTLTRISTQGNTITVSPLGAGTRILTRTFRVPPGFLTKASSASASTDEGGDPFASGEDSAMGSGLKISRMTARDWLTQNGIAFPEGTSADYSAGANQLIVRNTEENLDQIQTILEGISDKTQMQVLVQVRLLKAEHRHLQELGYDWLVGAAQLGDSGVFAAGGTFGNATNASNPLDYPLQSPAGGPVGNNPITAGLRGAFDLQTTPTIADLIVNGTGGGAVGGTRTNAILSTAGVFTSPQFTGLMRGLNQKSGIDLSIGQTLILKAGQRASAASLRTIRFPTEFDPPQIPQTITSPEITDLTTGITFILPSNDTPPVTPTTPQSFEDKETGSSIEVEATVGDDGTTVDLNLSLIFREFEGFINYGSPISSGGQILTENRIFQPVVSAINETAQVMIYDGETVAIGGLTDSKHETINDKVPLLGDLPFVGRFFRSDVTQVTRRAVVYFVSVKVIDPGGMGLKEAAAAAEAAAAISTVASPSVR